MLAKRKLSAEAMAWNKRWSAPFGKQGVPFVSSPPLDNNDFFAVQGNNDIRVWEYPWAYDALKVKRGMRVLDIGGGLSGLQFVLSREGAVVTNVDPGSKTAGVPFECDPETFTKLNRLFGTNVTLVHDRLVNAKLDEASFDVAMSISVIEHLAPEEVAETLKHVYRALKPGGRLVLTWDLFIDCAPFTKQETNRFGRNYPLVPDLKAAGFEFVDAIEDELYGSPGFDHDRVQSNISTYFLAAGYPAMIQAAVLRRPA